MAQHPGDSHPSEVVLSVFELAQGLRRTVEDLTTGVWVEGELAQVKRAPSGHVYFSLKDSEHDAMIDCVMYRREAMRFARHLEDGLRIQLRGRASFYAPRGRLQWIGEAVRLSGEGAILKALERLKEKLLAEGIFRQELKKPLPKDVRLVGVVTSAVGAAFSDICTVAKRRGPVRILLSPAVVQGEGAVESLLRAIDLLEKVPGLDVMIVGRGGGSQEDLMAFNDERVVRRIAACRVPVVSAVGHETDTSLSDLVADARAATPSEAAELVVADQAERRARLHQASRHLAQAMRGCLSAPQLSHLRLTKKLGDPRFLLAEHQQLLDELESRAERATYAHLRRVRANHEDLSRRLSARHPRAVLAQARAQLTPLSHELRSHGRRLVQDRRAAMARNVRALSALSPLAILGRGYALARDEAGTPILDADALSEGQRVTVMVSRGGFQAKVERLVPLVENPPGFPHESLATPVAGDNEA